jgi:hypothetical protein
MGLSTRFKAAAVTLLTLAGLKGLAGNAKEAKEARAKDFGHPLHAKLLKGKLDGCPAELHLTHRKSCSHYNGGRNDE